MTASQNATVRFQLTAEGSLGPVDVCLRSAGERWVATVEAGDRREVGVGANPRQALNAALSPFGARVTAALSADPALFGASTQLLRVAQGY